MSSVPARERSGFGQFQLNRSKVDAGVNYGKVIRVPTSDMAEMLRDGATLEEVSDAFGLAVSTIRSRLATGGWSTTGEPKKGKQP